MNFARERKKTVEHKSDVLGTITKGLVHRLEDLEIEEQVEIIQNYMIARLEFELAYYDPAVHRFNDYATRTPPGNLKSNNCLKKY